VGLKTFFCGPESFTPDMAPILGEAPELRGYYVAAGLNSIGILTGGGVGRAMAHWIVHGKPDVDVTQVRVRQWRGGGGITCESVGAASCVSVDAGMGRCAYGFVCGARETRSTTSTDCTSTRATQSTAGRASLRRWAECAFAHDDSGCGCSPLLLLPAAAATAVADAGADAAAVYGASPLIVTVARAAACARTRSYKTHYPAYATATARGVKRSAIYDRLVARGAYFRDVSGWEGADWFAPPGTDPKAVAARLTWGKHDWFPYWRAEHAACRNGVVLIDMSFMSKFLVQGADAGAQLNYLSTADVDGDAGVITYTQWLDDAGKMQADLTVAKLDAQRYFVVATDTAHRHVETWMRRRFEDTGARAVSTDVTGAYAQFNLQGPRSRELLAALTSADVGNEALPFRGVRDIDIGFARVTCVRITYVGELGYELYVPSEFALHVYERIVAAGEKHGLVHAGLKALGSLRMEKAYKDYGHDMDNTDTLMEVRGSRAGGVRRACGWPQLCGAACRRVCVMANPTHAGRPRVHRQF
jgi:glycine cleavage system aminomethyltransferase T